MKVLLGFLGLFAGFGLTSPHSFAFNFVPMTSPIDQVDEGTAYFDSSLPPCYASDKQTVLPVMNTQVLSLLHARKNTPPMRALVQGVFTNRYADQTGHAHFAIDLDGDRRGDLEVIYQYDFGSIPTIPPGTVITACGDYITDPRGSPNGGIIHWVHSNNGERDHGTCVHPDGYLAIAGIPYGITPVAQRLCR